MAELKSALLFGVTKQFKIEIGANKSWFGFIWFGATWFGLVGLVGKFCLE